MDSTRTKGASRMVVSSAQLRLIQESTPVGIPGHSSHPPIPGGEPKLELIRDGNLVTAIEITCSCGERLRIRLDYE